MFEPFFVAIVIIGIFADLRTAYDKLKKGVADSDQISRAS